MNFPKAFEGALAAAIVGTFGEIELPRIRTWQAIDAEGRWNPAEDRAFPMIGIRAQTPKTNEEDGITIACSVAVTVGTLATQDPAHGEVAKYYGAMQGTLDNLYKQFRAGVAGQERELYDAYLENSEPAINAILRIGGFQPAGEVEPYEEGGAIWVGSALIVHYIRTDY